jgi:ketosteroid isomerase-like protein
MRRRDLDAVAKLQHEDVVDDFVAVGVYRGKPAVRTFFEELFAAVHDLTLTPVTMSRDFTGGRYRNRTCDLFRVKEAR